MINYTGYNTSYLYDELNTFTPNIDNSITAQEVIKSFCDSFNNFVVYTIIIIGFLYILHEILANTKYKTHENFLSFEKLLFHFFGVFCVYETYFFTTRNLSESSITIVNYIMFALFILLCVFIGRKIYKQLNKTD